MFDRTLKTTEKPTYIPLWRGKEKIVKKAHRSLIAWIVAIFFAIWVFGAGLIWWTQSTDKPQDPAQTSETAQTSYEGLEQILWNGSMAVIALAAIISSIYFIKPDRIIAAVFLGEIYGAYAPEIHQENTPIDNLSGGIGGTDIALIFPPLLATGYHFPLTGFNIPFASIRANTKKTSVEAVTPIDAFVTITMRLAPRRRGLQKLIQAIPALLEHGADLASVTGEMQFFVGMTPDGTPKLEPKRCVKVATILAEQLQQTLDEAVSRAVAKHSLSKGLQSKKEIEESIKKNLQGTIFEQAGFLKFDAEGAPVCGDACLLFDINLADIIPSDADTAKAVSAETRENLNAKGTIAKAKGESQAQQIRGQGDAAYVEEVARSAQTHEGKLVLTSQTLRNLPDGTSLIATPDVLDAVVARVIKPVAAKVPETVPPKEEKTETKPPENKVPEK